MKKPILIYAHIPKTGGTTMRGILEKKFDELNYLKYPANKSLNEMKAIITDREPEIQCVYGHCRFGIHQYFHKPHTYMTMIRKPISRLISAFYFIKSQKENGLYPLVKNMTIREFIYHQDPRIQVQVNNFQTRFLCGHAKPTLKQAISHLKQHFSFVGITELYPLSVFLFCKKQKWKSVVYKRENTTKTKPDIIPLDKDDYKYLITKNQSDYYLYNLCRKKLLDQQKKLTYIEKKQLIQYLNVYQNRSKKVTSNR
ncbi:sulfotransferase family 2 domain-containing protein [Hazenella sp. IB182357]|uniref:Sulfotransferase family 2 domain-containing protein n=1 Tax=Polycladospora coralii TaxID=2771432 RepID=A0A926NA68_9BACL|nr:sulfotransferase family 2 domain-containing protein [Polycladospora coralii]MBD1371450.1 sulfotransferase family 2 domain-containing protein [Polycladospora coralii]MBS7530418.1 sulfotransferase family 2 domain-containing protein [Polycladospora coralii]